MALGMYTMLWPSILDRDLVAFLSSTKGTMFTIRMAGLLLMLNDDIEEGIRRRKRDQARLLFLLKPIIDTRIHEKGGGKAETQSLKLNRLERAWALT